MKAFIYFVALACAAMAVTAVPDTAPWVGSWSMQTSTCSTSTCCCVTGAVSIEADSTTSSTMKVIVALAGQCGGSYSAMATITTPQAGALTASFTVLGSTVVATKASTSSNTMTATAGAGCGSADFYRGTADPATWTGQWTVTSSTCNQATCCCVTGPVSVLEASSSKLSIQMNIAGVCGGSTSTSALSLTPTGASSFAFDGHGLTVKAEKTGTNDMKAVGSGNCGEAQLHRNAGVVHTISAFLLLALIAVAAAL